MNHGFDIPNHLSVMNFVWIVVIQCSDSRWHKWRLFNDWRFKWLIYFDYFLPARDGVDNDKIHKIVTNKNSALEADSFRALCLSILRFVNSVKEDGVSQVQKLEVLLNVPWVVEQVFLERLFKIKANKAASSQIEPETLTVCLLVPLQENVAMRNGTLFQTEKIFSRDKSAKAQATSVIANFLGYNAVIGKFQIFKAELIACEKTFFIKGPISLRFFINIVDLFWRSRHHKYRVAKAGNFTNYDIAR